MPKEARPQFVQKWRGKHVSPFVVVERDALPSTITVPVALREKKKRLDDPPSMITTRILTNTVIIALGMELFRRLPFTHNPSVANQEINHLLPSQILIPCAI